MTPVSKKLWTELVIYAFVAGFEAAYSSAFICHLSFGRFDWRAIAICVAAQSGSGLLDHYKDHRYALIAARKMQNDEIITIFLYAKLLLWTAILLLVYALAMSPLTTSIFAVIFVMPAFLWSHEFHCGVNKKPFVIKRIPGMKAIISGLIRGCGVTIVIRSIMPLSEMMQDPWTPSQLIVWYTCEGVCMSTLLDVRDFDDDMQKNIKTLPVLLKSVFNVQVLMTVIYTLNIMAFHSNIYLTFASLYAIAVVWMLDNRTPRWQFLVFAHTRALVVLLYAVSRLFHPYGRVQQ